MSPFSGSVSVTILVLAPAFVLAAEPGGPPLPVRAQAVLKTHCYRCHGQDGSAKGGFGYVLDRDKLVARGKVLPGVPAESELFQRVQDGEMPPPGKNPRPSKEELLVLKQWLEAGAPNVAGAAGPSKFVPENIVQRLIFEDLQTLNPRHRRFARYFTLTHLENAGLPEKDLQTTRAALSKLVNSLSWHPRVVRPTPIDPGQTIYRIDLRQFKWTAALWERVSTAYPYRLGSATPEARAIAATTETDIPYVRADWFVATASRPPLYHDLLQLPSTDRGLERLLQVEVPANIHEETASRAGFNDSGVSKNNRLIERHDAVFGAYWRSYDFLGNTGRQNLFEHPLGPSAGETSFAHAGGEAIFHLPNGLHGYLLMDALGRRVDKAPVEIVSDPRRPDQRVETGLSCMSCHARGFLFKADQVRAHVERNLASFRKATVESVRVLYPSPARLQAFIKEDNDRYLKALARTGVAADAQEPVNTVTLAYESTLDQRAAAAELGLTPPELSERLKQAPALARSLGPLRLKSGTVQREVFLEGFAEVVRALGLHEGRPRTPQSLPAGSAPFVGHSGPVLSVALSADGSRAASGGEDRTLRLWDVATGRELLRIDAHVGEVAAVVFSADGKRLVSAEGDRTVCLWDVATGKELCRLRGHTDRVRALAMSPDGRWIASGGEDHTVRLWDAATGRLLHSLTGHSRPVSSLAFASDGRLLSASHDGTLRLWDVATGRELRRFEGHAREVHCVALSVDGRRALSGGNDKSIRLWDVESGRELLRLEGHANAVIGVAFSSDGRRALSGSSRYRSADQVLRIWDLENGRQLQALGDDATGVGCVALAPAARLALSGSPDGVLRLWRWAK